MRAILNKLANGRACAYSNAQKSLCMRGRS
jgi:hypothetical protein